MKQAVTVITLSCIAILGVCQTPKDKGIPVQKSTSNAALNKNPDTNEQHTANLPNSTTAANQSASGESTSNGSNQSRDSIEVERKVAKFTGYLVGVGLLQFLILAVQAVLFFQQKKIMGQHKVSLEQLATAAIDNAKAAKDTVEAHINTERPWISTSIRKTVKSIRQPNKPAFEDVSYFHFVLTNHGRTPAEIYAMDGEPRLTDKGIDGGLSHQPDYSPDILKHVKLLAPNEEWTVEDVNLQTWHYSESDREGIRTDRLHVIFVGVVLYRDQFKRDVQRETRFCYTYMQGLSDYRPSGPPQYTKYT
jgi:hypothetical protein